MSSIIIELSQTRLHHEEHFQHKRETMDILLEYPELFEQLGPVAEEFARLLAEEDKSLETLTKSDLTKQIVDRDRQRDETTRGLFLHIKADTHHFNPAIREEAISLLNIRNHYRGITDKNFDEQTAATYNLLQDLNARSETLERLHLKTWTDQLAADNAAVYNLLKERDAEKSTQPVSRIRKIRPLMDAALKALYDALATFQRIFPEEADIPKCISALNALNKRFADRLSLRAGRRDASKKKPETPDTPDVE